jgi:hypothetical protein
MFGSEFIAIKTAVELIEALQYKLQMFGVLVDGLTSLLSDNDAVVWNTMAPESTLKKKHNSIAYHQYREVVLAQMVLIVQVGSKENLVDLVTKSLPALQQSKLVHKILW